MEKLRLEFDETELKQLQNLGEEAIINKTASSLEDFILKAVKVRK